jgi:integrase
MVKGTNTNHPAKGSKILVDPIRSIDDIKEIKELLRDNPLKLCLFVLGINTGLRASDILSIRAGEVRGVPAMGEIVVKEKKTSNLRRITLNHACVEAISVLLASDNYRDDYFLFNGQRGRFTVSTVGAWVKKWCRQCGVKGHFASHSMRKTFGFHQRMTFGVGLPELMKVFGHSSEQQTLAYIGIQPEDIQNIYANQI